MPSLEVESSRGEFHMLQNMFKGLVRHGNGGGSFKIADCAFTTGIKARHPCGLFCFGQMLSPVLIFMSWRAMICFPLRLKTSRKKNPCPRRKISASQPLAARMRPRNLDEYAGQTHILAPGTIAAPRD